MYRKTVSGGIREVEDVQVVCDVCGGTYTHFMRGISGFSDASRGRAAEAARDDMIANADRQLRFSGALPHCRTHCGQFLCRKRTQAGTTRARAEQ